MHRSAISGRDWWVRVPAYPPALGQIARINTAQGACQAAIDRLRPLASASDDPAYAASLARALIT